MSDPPRTISGMEFGFRASQNHVAELKERVEWVMRGLMSPAAFRDWCALCVQQGRPVDANVVVAPDEVVQIEVRRVCLAVPSLSHLHGEAEGWLEAHAPHVLKSRGGYGFLLTGSERAQSLHRDGTVRDLQDVPDEPVRPGRKFAPIGQVAANLKRRGLL